MSNFHITELLTDGQTDGQSDERTDERKRDAFVVKSEGQGDVSCKV